MKKFSYVIKDEQGIHARPAGELVKLCNTFSSNINIEKDGKKADAKRIFAIMSLAAKMNDEILVTVEGNDEDKAATSVEEFLKANL